jgi:hypothetical protein
LLLRVFFCLAWLLVGSCVVAQVVHGLETDGQIAFRARSREGDGAEFLGRQPVSVARNIDDRFGYSLAPVPTLRMLFLQAHAPHSDVNSQR